MTKSFREMTHEERLADLNKLGADLREGVRGLNEKNREVDELLARLKDRRKK